MYEHSITAKGIKKAALLFDACYRGSKTASLLERLQRFLTAVLAGSIVVNILWFRDVSLSLWEHSLICRLYTLGQRTAKKALAGVSALLGTPLENSISYRLCRSLLSRLYLLFILFGALALSLMHVLPVVTALKLTAAAAAGFLVLYNAAWGLFIFAFILPFLPNTAVLLLSGLVGASFVLHRLRTGRLTLKPLPVEPALVLYLLIAAATTLASIHLSGSIRDLAMYVAAFIIFFVLLNQLQSKEQLGVFLSVLLFGALLVSLFGVYQYIVGAPMPAGWVDATQNPTIRTRVYSVFGNPNVFAEYLVMMIPFGAALFFAVKHVLAKLVFLGATGIFTLTLLLTFSRGGWLGLLVGLLVFALLKDRRILILILIAALLGTALMPDVILKRIGTIGSPLDSSNSYRFTVWRETIRIIRSFPLTGVGLGHQSFMKIYPFYMLDRGKRPFHSHNSYLQTLAETGIIGLLVFLWLLAGTFKRGLKAVAATRDPFLKHIIIASLAAIAGVLVQGMGEVIIYLPKITTLFWMNVALIFLCIQLDKDKTVPEPAQ